MVSYHIRVIVLGENGDMGIERGAASGLVQLAWAGVMQVGLAPCRLGVAGQLINC